MISLICAVERSRIREQTVNADDKPLISNCRIEIAQQWQEGKRERKGQIRSDMRTVM